MRDKNEKRWGAWKWIDLRIDAYQLHLKMVDEVHSREWYNLWDVRDFEEILILWEKDFDKYGLF